MLSKPGSENTSDPSARGGSVATLRSTGDWAVVALLSLSLLLIVAGVRFWIISEYASDLPYWDQWGSERIMYQRFLGGTLRIGDLFAAHNEHRLFFSNLLSLGLLSANGQWDARLQMVVNSTLYSAFAAALFLTLARDAGLRLRLLLFLAIAATLAHPFGWENTIWGFQSQFYLLAACSCATLWLLVNSKAWSWPWAAGCLLGFAGLFTMASGLVAGVAVMGALACAALRERRNWRSCLASMWPTYAVCILMVLAGLALSVKVELHAQYQAKALLHFFRALGSCLSWPGTLSRWWALVNWLPFVLWALLYLRRKTSGDNRERFVLALGFWVVLQAAATAYSRAYIVGSSRYVDMFSYGLLVNALCIYLVAKERRHAVAAKAGACLLAALWLAGNLHGVYVRSHTVLPDKLYGMQYSQVVQKARTAGYLLSGDFRWLSEGIGAQNLTDLPYGDGRELSRMLDDPKIHSVLPASVRTPLALSPLQGGPLLQVKGEMDSMAAPYVGERIWTGRAAPGGDAAGGFTCGASKAARFPYLFFQVKGDPRQLSVTDAAKTVRALVPLGSKGSGPGWQAVYAYCPGPVVSITAAAGSAAPVAFTEPREMGRLSGAALALVVQSALLIGSGVLVLCGALVLGAKNNWDSNKRG